MSGLRQESKFFWPFMFSSSFVKNPSTSIREAKTALTFTKGFLLFFQLSSFITSIFWWPHFIFSILIYFSTKKYHLHYTFHPHFFYIIVKTISNRVTSLISFYFLDLELNLLDIIYVKVLRERDGIPDLRRAARFRYASVTLPQVGFLYNTVQKLWLGEYCYLLQGRSKFRTITLFLNVK